MRALWQKIEENRAWLGMHLLRYAMAAVFLWFGFSQLIDSLAWVSYVPAWASNLLHLSPAMIVMANGAFEVVAASLMAAGFLVRIVALLLALHLIPIALSFGLTAIGVRDFGLSLASFALALIHIEPEVPIKVE